MVKYQSAKAEGEMINAEDIVRNRLTGAIGTVTAVADGGYVSVRYRTGEDLGGLQEAFEIVESAEADVPGAASNKIADGVYSKVTLTGPAPYGGTCTSVTTDPKVAELIDLGYVVTRSWTVTYRDGVPVRPGQCLVIDGNQVTRGGKVVAILRWAGVRRVMRPDGTLLGRLYPSSNRQTWRAWTAWDQFECTSGDEELARCVPLADAVAALLKARDDVLYGRHEGVPAPGSITNAYANAVLRGAQDWEYPQA